MKYSGTPQGAMNPTVTKLFFLKNVPLMKTCLGSYVSLDNSVIHNKAQKGLPAKQRRFSFNLFYSSNWSIIEVLQRFRTQLNNDTKPAKKLNTEQLEKEDKFREPTEVLVFL